MASTVENGKRLWRGWTESPFYQYPIVNGTLKSGPPRLTTISGSGHGAWRGGGKRMHAGSSDSVMHSTPCPSPSFLTLFSINVLSINYLIKRDPTGENWGTFFMVSVFDAVRLIGGVCFMEGMKIVNLLRDFGI
jgi:hypothetical protein